MRLQPDMVANKKTSKEWAKHTVRHFGCFAHLTQPLTMRVGKPEDNNVPMLHATTLPTTALHSGFALRLTIIFAAVDRSVSGTLLLVLRIFRSRGVNRASWCMVMSSGVLELKIKFFTIE
jgi:hypothetical protein